MNPTDPQRSQPPTPDTGPAVPLAPSRRDRRLWVIAAAAAAAGVGWSWWRSARGVSTPGSQGASGASGASSGSTDALASSPDRLGADFWTQTLPQPDGQPLDMARFQGRPLLVNFWATWCPPCIREMPLLDRFHREQASNGLQVLGIAVDSPTPVQAFLDRSPVGFPIAMAGAEGSNWARALGNTQGGLPYTILADTQGRVIRRQMGELQPEHLAQWVAALSKP